MFATVNHNFATVFHNGNSCGLASGVARVRPVFHPALGKWLTETRESKRRAEGNQWSLRNAAEMARRQGLKTLSYQILFRLERGQVKHVSRDVLEAVSRLYGLAYHDLLSRYIASEYGLHVSSSDQSRHAGTSSSGLSKGAHADAVAAAETDQRIQDLEGKVLIYEAILATARSLTTELAAALGPEGSEGPDAAPRRRKRTGTDR